MGAAAAAATTLLGTMPSSVDHPEAAAAAGADVVAEASGMCSGRRVDTPRSLSSVQHAPSTRGVACQPPAVPRVTPQRGARPIAAQGGGVCWGRTVVRSAGVSALARIRGALVDHMQPALTQPRAKRASAGERQRRMQ